MGILIVKSPWSPLALAVVLALASPLPTLAEAAPATGAAVQYDIPPGALGEALNRFAQQSGVAISVDAAQVAGLRSPGLTGAVGVEEGFAILLQGSGFIARRGEAGYVLMPAPRPLGKKSDELLPEVMVKGDPHDVTYETAGSVSVITRADLDKVAVSSARDIFAETPGVWVMDGRQNTGINVNIRGMQGEGRNNVMVDGTRQNFSRYGGYNGIGAAAYVDPELIADVAVEKGPTAGAHGAGTIGGVVNLRTLEARDILGGDKDWAGRIRGSFGDHDENVPGVGSLAAAFRISEQVDVLVGASHRKLKEYDSGRRGVDAGLVIPSSSLVPNPPEPGEAAPHTEQDIASLLAKIGFSWGDGHRFTLGTTRYESDYTFDLTGMSPTWGSPLHQESSTLTGQYAWSPQAGGLVDLRANIWRATNENTGGGMTRELDTWGAELHNLSRFSVAMLDTQFNYGVEYFEDTFNQANTVEAGGKRRIGSAFALLRLLPAYWLELEGGLRSDAYNLQGGGEMISLYPGRSNYRFTLDRSDARVNPSLGLSLRPLDGLLVYARYSEGMRPPTLSEVIAGGGFMTPVLPNPLLKPEIARNREYGISYLQKNLLLDQDRLSLKVSYFDNRYSDYINRSYMPYGYGGNAPANAVDRPQTVLTYINLDSAHFRGWETLVGYDAGFAFVDASLTHFSEMTFCNTGRSWVADGCTDQVGDLGDFGAPYVPPENKITANLGVRVLDRKITLATRMRYDSEIIDGVGAYDWRWQGYRLYDVYGSYDVLPTLKLSFSVENVQDIYFVDAMSGGLLPGPGRTSTFSFAYQF